MGNFFKPAETEELCVEADVSHARLALLLGHACVALHLTCMQVRLVVHLRVVELAALDPDHLGPLRPHLV